MSRRLMVSGALVLFTGLAFALDLGGSPVMSTIELAKTADFGSFARYVPFGDRREVIVRRGEELGFWYGFEQGRRKVKVEGGEFELVKYQNRLSPPPLLPGKQPLSAVAAKQYEPVRSSAKPRRTRKRAPSPRTMQRPSTGAPL